MGKLVVSELITSMIYKIKSTWLVVYYDKKLDTKKLSQDANTFEVHAVLFRNIKHSIYMSKAFFLELWQRGI